MELKQKPSLIDTCIIMTQNAPKKTQNDPKKTQKDPGFHCTYCNKGFSTKAHMRRHELHRCKEKYKNVNNLVSIINDNPKQVEDYKKGKTKIIGFFVGQVLKNSQGADPGSVKDEIIKLLDEI